MKVSCDEEKAPGDRIAHDLTEIEAALAKARSLLLSERNLHWEGELSSSALSTATAVTGLSIVAREAKSPDADLPGLAEGGLGWLAQNQNPDGGWGDTIRSKSNISTTALCWAAFGAVPGGDS